jgi:hypothetical protein
MSGAPTLRSPPQPEAIIRDHAPLDSGRYTITNVRFKNLAVLPDSNHESQIVARARHDNSGEIVCCTPFYVTVTLITLLSGTSRCPVTDATR